MKKIHKYIILGLLCLFASLEAFAQEVLISGVVKDKNDNQPLPYVSVVVRDKSGKIDSRHSISTNKDGEFTLQVLVPTGSGIDYKAQIAAGETPKHENEDIVLLK